MRIPCTFALHWRTFSVHTDFRQGGENSSGKELHDKDMMRNLLWREIKRVRQLPVESCAPLRRIYENTKAKRVVETANSVLNEVVQTPDRDIDITDINHIVYATRYLVSQIILGPTTNTDDRQQNRINSPVPPWTKRTMKRIADTRREISLLAEASSKSTHTTKVQRKIIDVEQKYRIENDTSRLVVVEKLKEKIQAWAQRIRRYKRRINFRIQNRLFE